MLQCFGSFHWSCVLAYILLWLNSQTLNIRINTLVFWNTSKLFSAISPYKFGGDSTYYLLNIKYLIKIKYLTYYLTSLLHFSISLVILTHQVLFLHHYAEVQPRYTNAKVLVANVNRQLDFSHQDIWLNRCSVEHQILMY